MKIKLTFLLLFFFVLLSIISAAQDKINFKPKLKIGDKFIRSIDVSNESEITMQIQGSKDSSKTKQKMDISQEYEMSVLNKTSQGGYELELKLIKLKIALKSLNSNVTFDSDYDTSDININPEAFSIRGVVGAKALFIVDSMGKILEVKNIDKFTEWVMLSSPQGMKPIAQGLFNETSLKKIFSQFIPQKIPNKEIVVGESWDYSEEIPFTSKDVLIFDTISKFSKWSEIDNKKCAIIETTATVKNKLPDEQTNITIKENNIYNKMWFFPQIQMSLKIEGIQEFSYENKPKKIASQVQSPYLTKTKQTVTSKLIKYPE